jgi:DNA polymerase-3 subunit gamma/tau
MSYEIFARRYRPQTFEEMIGQRSVVQTLQNAIRTNRVTQAYLFSGMRGTGKTTAARILAKALNCANGPTPTPCNTCESCLEIREDRSIDVLEIDGASNRGIDDIRALREGLKYKPIRSRYKIIIIDEVHQVTGPAFNALLKTLEEPPENTVFIFATTEFNKVPPTIVSRCQHFEFKKISQKEIINHLMDISKSNGITISPSALALIAHAAEGSLRDAQSLLDQAVAFSGEVINDDDLKEILGTINPELLYACSSAILEEKAGSIFALVDGLIEGGHELRVFYKDLVEHFRNLLLAASLEKPQDLLFMNAEEMGRLVDESKKASPEEFLRYLLALQQGEAGLRYSSHPRIYLESLLVKLCHFRKLVPLADLVRELEDARKGPGPSGPGAAGGQAPPGTAPERQVKPSSPSALTQPGFQAPPKAYNETPAASRPRSDSIPSKTQSKAVPAGPSPEAKAAFARILEGLQKEKAALAAVLAQYSSFKIGEEALEVVFAGDKKFYLDTIKRDARLIERVASEVTGRKLVLRLLEREDEAAPRGDSPEKEAVLKDPAVQYFMNTFKAQVLSVDPVKKPQDREVAGRDRKRSER